MGQLSIVVVACAILGLMVWSINDDNSTKAAARNETVCIGGIKYYMIEKYQRGFMAPAYDPKTLQVKICD